jgi:glutamyl-tRNA synthetase
MTKDIRVRFAPSPTGSLHIGNARTALFNWLFAKKQNGIFVLRIEDTDTARSTKESEEGIIKDLTWLGITYDEGPDTKGGYSPYRQSERIHIYEEYLNRLIEQKRAYRCYCAPKELEEERKRQLKKSLMPSYSGKCRDMTVAKEEEFTAQGRKPAVRLLVKEKKVIFNDLVKGEISYDSRSLGGDFIIMRSNGGFIYNFTVVIDDALMKMSHVIRGDDHLTNTVKQLLLYEVLGLEPPKFAHCPMIVGKDRKRLSKRFLKDSFTMFRKDGILPDALINYIVLLGWSSKDVKEIFSKEELIQRFDLKNISSSPSAFSYNKLKWINSEHIKRMIDEDFSRTLFDFMEETAGNFLKKYSPLLDTYTKRFSTFARLIKNDVVILKDALESLEMFFSSIAQPSSEAVRIINQNNAVSVAKLFLKYLKEEKTLDKETYKNITKKIKKDLNISGENLFMPIRAAVTGSTKGPHLEDICLFLGRDVIINRIEYILKKHANEKPV